MNAFVAIVCLSCAALAACDTLGATDPEGPVGMVEMPLRVTATGGGVLRLVNAEFLIEDTAGNFTRTINANGNMMVVKTTLRAGDYVVSLQPGWELKLDYEGTLYDAGDFVLEDDAPQNLRVEEGSTSLVMFSFKRKNQVTIGVEAPSRRITGFVSLETAVGDFAALAGTQASFNWDVAAVAEYDISSLDMAEESFQWNVGAPAFLTTLFADYSTTAVARSVSLAAMTDGGVMAYVQLRWAPEQGTFVELFLEGKVAAPVLNTSGDPVLLPFCVTQGDASLRRWTSLEEDRVWGPGTVCFE